MSWQYPLLLPCCVRPISSPPSSIGTPCDSISVARKLRCWRARRRHDLGLVRRPLAAAVPGTVVAFAVAVAFAVGLVVLVVVRHEISEREAVVRGDEVDARVRTARRALVKIRAAGQPVRELGKRSIRAAPEVPHRVAILAVPLRPERRKVAHLIAALADVPGLGNQLHLADDRILLDEIEKRRQAIDLVQFARERRGQIETKAVDVHLDDPVAQAVHDELQHVGMPHVHRVAGARVVDVVAAVLAAAGGSRRRCRAPSATARARDDCPRRCGCRPRRESLRCPPRASSSRGA